MTLYLFLFHDSRFKIIVNLSALNVIMCNLGAVVTFKIKSLLTYLLTYKGAREKHGL